MSKLSCLLLAAFFASSSLAAEIRSYVGDPDGLGFGIPDGGQVLGFSALFDNRSTEEMNATNGAQETDRETTGGGVTIFTHEYLHTFSIPPNAIIESAAVILGIGGLESNDNDPNTQRDTEDELILDGVIVPEAFEPLVQGGHEFDADYTVQLPEQFFPSLMDGVASVEIDANATSPDISSAEPVYLDYSLVVVVFSLPAEPIPSIQGVSRALLILAILGLGLVAAANRPRWQI